MNSKISDRIRAILTGTFLLIAYGVLASSITQQKLVVLLADVISGIAVIGIAVLMYPLFKLVKRKVSKVYLVLKYTEGILMITGGFIFLGSSTQYLRSTIYEDIHVYVFIISAFLFYYLLYETKLVPRFVSVWGTLGIFALLVSTFLSLLQIEYPALDYLLVLIITNEMFLAIWLMAKGFDKTSFEN